MRSIALAESLQDRGDEVQIIADVQELAWVAQELRHRGLPVRSPAADLVEQLHKWQTDVAYLDHYRLSPSLIDAIASELATLTMADGSSGSHRGHVIVDQNGMSVERGNQGPGLFFYGPQFALIRRDVRLRRPSGPKGAPRRQRRPPRFLVVLGGTDPAGLTETVTRAVLDAAPACEVRALVNRSIVVRPTNPHQVVHVTPPGPALADWIRESDVVIAAAGSSIYDAMCLGAAPWMIQVADNQESGYANAIAEHRGVGLLALHEVTSTDVSGLLAGRIRERLESAQELLYLNENAWRTVDGRGADRIAQLIAGLT